MPFQYHILDDRLIGFLDCRGDDRSLWVLSGLCTVPLRTLVAAQEIPAERSISWEESIIIGNPSGSDRRSGPVLA